VEAAGVRWPAEVLSLAAIVEAAFHEVEAVEEEAVDSEAVVLIWAGSGRVALSQRHRTKSTEIQQRWTSAHLSTPNPLDAIMIYLCHVPPSC
jgi:hypothetical protein